MQRFMTRSRRMTVVLEVFGCGVFWCGVFWCGVFWCGVSGCTPTAPLDAGLDAPTVDSGMPDSPRDTPTMMDAGGDSLSPCDPFVTPSTCPSGETCATVFTQMSAAMDSPLASFAFRCVAIATPRRAGEACVGRVLSMMPMREVTSDCATGLTCAGQAMSFVCQPTCTTMHPACMAGSVCNPLADTASLGFGICSARVTDPCDPILQTGCGAGLACYLLYHLGTPPETACLTPTPPAEAIAEGEICPGGGCGAGFTCVAGTGADTTRRCRRFCDPVPSLDAGMEDAGMSDAGIAPGGCGAVAPSCTLLETAGTARPVGVCR